MIQRSTKLHHPRILKVWPELRQFVDGAAAIMAPAKIVCERAVTLFIKASAPEAPAAKPSGPWLPGAINRRAITMLRAGEFISPRAKDPTNDPDATVVIDGAVITPRLPRQ